MLFQQWLGTSKEGSWQQQSHRDNEGGADFQAGRGFQIVEREIPKPGAGEVRIQGAGLWCLPQ